MTATLEASCRNTRVGVEICEMSLPDFGKLKDGDEDEWDAFFILMWPVAIAAAKKMLYYRWPNEVEDIAIASITKLIRHVLRAEEDLEKLKATLSKITHDECVGFIRKIKSLKRGEGNVYSLEEIIENLGDFQDPDSTVNHSHRDLIRLILNLCSKLNLKERQVFEDFHIDKLTYKQISEKHGIPVNSVGVHLKRALEKLRDLLGGMGEDFL